MSKFTNNDLITRRPNEGPVFSFPDQGGDCFVDLDGYVIAPKELFAEGEIDRLVEKAHQLFPHEIDTEALRKQRTDDEERERLRSLGVAFVDN